MSATPPRPPPPPQGFLHLLPPSKLKTTLVTIHRANVTSCNSPGPVKRNIEDPEEIKQIVHHHVKKDNAGEPKSIFDGNVVPLIQKNGLLLANENRLEEYKFIDRSTSNSPRKEGSSSNCKERNKSGNSRLDEQQDAREFLDSERKENLCKDNDRNIVKNERTLDRQRSLDRDFGRNLDGEKNKRVETCRDKGRYADRPCSRERNKENNRRRSKTPLRLGEYRPNHNDVRRRTRSRDREHPNSKYRSYCRRSRSLSQRRFLSLEYRKPSTSRKPSRSPEPHSLERSRRDRSPSRYRRERNRTRSPNEYPGGSKSRSTSSRHERYSRRRSRSPGERNTQKKRSRFSKSHSPISHSDHRLPSRSPDYERDISRSKKHRSRSQSRSRSRSRSPRHHWEPNFNFYEGVPANECWMPAPIQQSFPGMHRFYPPAFYPRIPSAPMIIPPRFPIVAPYPAFRQRLPVYNTRPRLNTPTQSQSSNTNSATTTVIDAGANKNDNNKM